MKINMTPKDRFIRFILVIVIIILLWAQVLKGALATILGILGIILVITSVYGFCPFYAVLKVSPGKKKKQK
ncbi:MAG TPA: DUF2892 domain-containing protein [candidate division WOR-3 bacterium]|uniref:DUF2892 domain-containing protein n=1 Tax=candidate division WOR-3 bacterium TaxID=2052148 RepID=A0A9C9K003_UNCW3|nr:DUF2892 domain-containing protein [candidate division WOR-3 bacterium]